MKFSLKISVSDEYLQSFVISRANARVLVLTFLSPDCVEIFNYHDPKEEANSHEEFSYLLEAILVELEAEIIRIEISKEPKPEQSPKRSKSEIER